MCYNSISLFSNVQWWWQFLLLSKEYLKRNAKMEKLFTNHPRFCAKYVKPIGVAKETKVGWTCVFEMNGKFYIIFVIMIIKFTKKFGLLKKSNTRSNMECSWNHNSWTLLELWIPLWTDSKEQRTNPYEPRPCYYLELNVTSLKKQTKNSFN